jgi:hypothetical protein
MTYKAIELMTKAELLVELEQNVPQGYWPPRPTRQDKKTLLDICVRARADRIHNAKVIAALRLRKAETARQAAYDAAANAHPLPISGTGQ